MKTRFLPNYLNITLNELAYIISVFGFQIDKDVYDRLPNDIKRHFTIMQETNTSEEPKSTPENDNDQEQES